MKTNSFVALLISVLSVSAAAPMVNAQSLEKIPYGDFNSWITRNIKESRVLGGNIKKVYAVGPTKTMASEALTTTGGSPWASSNVLAKVMGVTKGSNAVYPADHPGNGKCAKMCTEFEHVKAAGMINMDVVVAGTLFLGKMLEPVKSTKNPYAKMEMGIPYTKTPKALVFDYKLVMPAANTRIYSSGFGSKKTLQGADKAEVIILLQERWEDAKGNLYAKRVGTGRELFGKTSGWVSGHRVPVHYGNAATVFGLIPAAKSYYATNSKGKMVPVHETGWAPAGTKPTHMIVLMSSGSGAPYTGTIGTEFYVDNVALAF